MRIKTTLLLIAFIFVFFNNAIKAANIVVTVNADAGPGTLREALTIAAQNGATDQDIITFNLPGTLPSDRTIRLKTQLPLVTANVIIDGTSQPGTPFGVSDSKVIIEPETSPAHFNALNIIGDYTTNNVTQNVEIYGLYIRNFAKITNLVTYDSSQGSGIYIQGNSSGIKIGAPGKGNVICGVINGIYNNTNYYYNTTAAGDITIQSNIIGLADDGKTAISNIYGINLTTFNSITIGGDAANLGNTIASCVSCVNISPYIYYNITSVAIAIKNNKIGTDRTGTIDYKQSPLFLASAFIKTYGINVSNTTTYAGTTTADISSNVISGQIGYGVFISYANYSIKNNKIGTDVTGTLDLGNYEGIRSDVNASGTIGGTGGSDKNYIGHNSYGIDAVNSKQVTITQNSIFCNNSAGINVVSNIYAVPFVQVLTFRSDMVAGLATPNSTIELFYSDDCGSSLCQGKEYLATVQSDGSGKWSYSGTITHTVVATATNAQKNTSPFSSLTLSDTEPVIKQYTCAYDGSITIPQPRDGILFHWDKKEDDGTLTTVADVQNIDHLLPGMYQLTIQYPGGCQKIMHLYQIKDQRIKIQNIIEPVPQCRQKSFPVSANYQGGTGNVVFRWVNDQGITVATGLSSNIPGGKYVLRITDDAGCDVTSNQITITPKPGPDLDVSHRIITASPCGTAQGSIKGLVLLPGIGTTTYSWKDAAGNEVGTSLDLVNVKTGTYFITMTDQSQCSPYTYPSSFFVSETQSVFISEGFYTPATCGKNNGALTVPTPQNANKYRWTSPSGAALTQYDDKLVLTNLVDGNYTLVATNTTTGCSNSRVFTVTRVAPDTFSPSVSITPVTCGLGNNGGITVAFNGVNIPATYLWTNQNGFVTNKKDVTNAIPGKYTLTVTDGHYGCQSVLLQDIVIPEIPKLIFDASNSPIAQNDVCDQQFGKITGVKVDGTTGVPPYSYQWTDVATGKVVGTQQDLTGVGRGTYQLVVTDGTACGRLDEHDIPAVVVGNDENIPAPPAINGQRICDPQTVALNVRNPEQHGIYKLYEHYNDIVPAATSVNGQFTTNVKQSTDYYLTFTIGSCESSRTKVHIEVVLVDISMGNTFTPNNDGKNDTWKITGLEKFPGTTVQIFSREGKLVFSSVDYAKPFDGTSGGKVLPVGTYYYVININIPCKIISGNLTILH